MEKTEGKDKGCCKDKQQFVKNVADQKVAESSIQFTQSFANAISVGFFEPSINYFSSATEVFPFSNAPPRSAGLALFLFNQAFLI